MRDGLAAALKAAHDGASRRDAWDAVAGVVSDREAKLVAYVQWLEEVLRNYGEPIDPIRDQFGIAFEETVTA